MKIICVVKFVPDKDGVVYNAETRTMACKTDRIILNPDDACALAFALQVKSMDPDCTVEVVSMGPMSVRPHMEDLLRLAADSGTLICDPVFDYGDSFGTSRVLANYITTRPFDCILTGTASLDSGSCHVPVQMAEILGLDQMLGIIRIDPHCFNKRQAVFDVMDEKTVTTYEMAMPCVLSVARESGYKLPYIKLKDMQRDVSDTLDIITNKDLGFLETEIGQTGSLIKIIKTDPQAYGKKDIHVVKNDEQGISYVFNFLKQRGFL